jgi:hypothetical protein
VAALADPSAAVSANAAGALATLYAAGAAHPSADAGAALCHALDTRRHPIVRANVLEALARGGRHCRLEAQRRMLLDGRQLAVREAALDSLTVAARIDPDVARALVATALEQCASADPDARLAARCRDARSRVGADAEGAAPPVAPGEPLDVAVMTEDEDALATNAPYAVVLANGVSRMGWTSAGGWIHERLAPAGDYRVLEPDELPLEP